MSCSVIQWWKRVRWGTRGVNEFQDKGILDSYVQFMQQHLLKTLPNTNAKRRPSWLASFLPATRLSKPDAPLMPLPDQDDGNHVEKPKLRPELVHKVHVGRLCALPEHEVAQS